jgi:hypothetical protein
VTVGLLDQVRALLDAAGGMLEAPGARERLTALRRRLDEPLRVAIAGRVKAGKSTLFNALVGQELAATDAGECTRIVTWYRDGVTYRVTLYPVGEPPVEVPFRKGDGAIDPDLRGYPPERIERLVVDWPSAKLREMTLIDTPGIDSTSVDVSERATAFLTAGEDHPTASDAVLYLMQHLHPADIRFLDAFRDQDVATPAPINAIGVLSRADEIGAGKLDGMATAARIAARYRQDPRVRGLCQTVVPVAALLAQAGATLREEEFRSLKRIADAPQADRDELLLSADRFGVLPAATVDAEDRRGLLDRLGMFGVRLSVHLVRTGEAPTSSRLAAALTEHSGLRELRSQLLAQFAGRRDVLKARAALLALEALGDEAGGPVRERIAGEVERVRAGAHGFAEIQLLNALRAGLVDFPGEEDAVERLLGMSGTPAATRLGLPEEATDERIRATALKEADRWRSVAESPLTPRARSTAASVLVRTCEGIVSAR